MKLKLPLLSLLLITTAIPMAAWTRDYHIDKNYLLVYDKHAGNHYIDRNGNRIAWIDEYDEIYAFRDGMAICKIGEKYGYINKKGELAIPTIYDDAFAFCGNYAFVRKGEGANARYFTIDKTGNVVHAFSKDLFFGPEIDQQPFGYKNGFLLYANYNKEASRNDNWFIINHLGKVLTKPIYDNIFIYGWDESNPTLEYHYTNDNVLILRKDAVYKEIDDENSIRISPDLYGTMNLAGTPIIPMKYSDIINVGSTLSAYPAEYEPENLYEENRDPWKWIRFSLDGKRINIPEQYLLDPGYGDPTQPYFQAYDRRTKRMGLLDKKSIQ